MISMEAKSKSRFKGESRRFREKILRKQRLLSLPMMNNEHEPKSLVHHNLQTVAAHQHT